MHSTLASTPSLSTSFKEKKEEDTYKFSKVGRTENKGVPVMPAALSVPVDSLFCQTQEQTLASSDLIGISPSGIFIKFSTLLTYLNSVGSRVWKGALISWSWWNTVMFRQSVCHSIQNNTTEESGASVGLPLGFPTVVLAHSHLRAHRTGCYLFILRYLN